MDRLFPLNLPMVSLLRHYSALVKANNRANNNKNEHMKYSGIC